MISNPQLDQEYSYHVLPRFGRSSKTPAEMFGQILSSG